MENKMKNIILIMALLISACSTLSNNYENEEMANLYPKIAEESAQILSEHYPAGKTIFQFKPVGQFGLMFEQNLIKKGFGISVTERSALPLNYIIDTLDQNHFRLALIVQNWRRDIIYNKDGIKLTQTQGLK